MTTVGPSVNHCVSWTLPSAKKTNKIESTKSPKKTLKSISAPHRVSGIGDDSDSDSEDLHYVIEEAGKALLYARATLKGGESLTSADYAEVVATCGEHLRCLQTIGEHISIDGKESSFSPSDLSQLHYLIEEWQDLKRMCEKAEDPAKHPYHSAREKVDAMYHRLSTCSALEVSSITSWEDVLENLARLQDVLMDLQAAKDQLLAVNLQVHRFTTEYGHDAQYRDCTLKADVTELYRQWEDLYERNGLQLTEMETVKKEWETFYDPLESLRLRLKTLDSEDDCDNLICLTSAENADCGDSLRQSFEFLKRASLSLENRLKGGDAWKIIDRDLNDLEKRIKRLDTSPNKTTFRSANHRSPSTLVEEDADDHFEDAIQQLCEDNEEPTELSTHHEKEASPASPKKRGKSRFWRIVRMAVPVQLALVLLYCLACYMEPSCCNMLNNFNFSLTPQLRYFEGPPPV